MNETERQIFVAAFAAAFMTKWKFLCDHKGVREAMNETSDGFQFAEIADQAVLSYRNSLRSEDRSYLLSVRENWPV